MSYDPSPKNLRKAKAALLQVLKDKGIAHAEVEYDGEGDSGQVNDIRFLDADNAELQPAGAVTVSLVGDPKPNEYETLQDAVESFVWDLLHAYHSGFENNEGGHGTITIDVAKGSVLLDHNDRVIDVVNTMTEV